MTVAVALVLLAWAIQRYPTPSAIVVMGGAAPEPFQALWSRLDPAITIATLAFAALIWFEQIQDSWERSLPVYLTAVFHVGDETAFRCEYALLVDESPRAWAQQVGRQMNDRKLLELSPILKPGAPRIEYWRDSWIRHRVVHLSLRAWPESLAREDAPRVWNHDNDFGARIVDAPNDAAV